MENPKISIIIPVYNVKKYIHQCLDSILSQTFPYFECILVNDYSSDDSGKICDEYAKKDGRIKVIHKQKNEGSSLARKTGFENSAGEYIQFVDSDDWIELDMTEKLYQAAICENYDMVYCDWYCYDTAHNVLHNKAPKLSNDFIANIKSLNFSWGCVVWNKLVKREIYTEIIFPKYSACEDTYITTQSLFFSKNIGYVSDPLYCYRYNTQSIIQSPRRKWKNYFEGKSNFIESYKFIKQKYNGDTSLFEPELSIAIRRAKLLNPIVRSVKQIIREITPVKLWQQMKKWLLRVKA